MPFSFGSIYLHCMILGFIGLEFVVLQKKRIFCSLSPLKNYTSCKCLENHFILANTILNKTKMNVFLCPAVTYSMYTHGVLSMLLYLKYYINMFKKTWKN